MARHKREIAWEIFSEVNEINETYKHIDLNCLDYVDAMIMVKQKLFDLAVKAQKEHVRRSMTEDFIMNIRCAEDHLIPIEDELGRTPLKNVVLETIRLDLGLDFYYISA